MPTVPVKLLFADGAVHTLAAEPGQKLVDVATEAGLNLLTDCANGQCGTCAAMCLGGAVDLDAYDPAVLPDDEREDGSILCCVARVREPAVIELPYDASEASASETPPQAGRVRAVSQVADEIVKLEIDAADAVDFLPGQYVRLRPQGVDAWRSYSMANRSGERHLVFYVRMVAGGAFSSWLAGMPAPGTPIEVSAPRGSFFLREEDRPRMFVAGGTGLAPFLAMLQSLREDARTTRAPIHLLVGGRTGGHFFARDQIEQLQRDLPGLHVHYAAQSQAPEGCREGHATDLIEPRLVPPGTRVYLCGPPPMVDAARTAVLQAGARKGDVLCERFT